ncbi:MULTISPECIES: hypothetical protein [Undibacterium]|nr:MULTISPECIES: hypothetical protein [Undibacterium]
MLSTRHDLRDFYSVASSQRWLLATENGGHQASSMSATFWLRFSRN